MFSTTDYRCVIALHEEGNFARAAVVVGISQPALTGRLRRIEDQLGVRLFERGRRGAHPTPAGHAFAQAAREIVHMTEQAVDAARDADRGLGQFLSVGMTQIAATQIVVPVLAAFRMENPYARLRLLEANSATLEAQVEENRIDVAFLHPPIHLAGLSELTLMSQKAAKYDARTYRGATPPAIRYTRKDAPVIVAEIDRKNPETADRPALVEANTVLGAAVLSQAGYGPFFAPTDWPNPFGADEIAAGGQGADMELGTSVVWRSLDRRPMVRALLDVCRRS